MGTKRDPSSPLEDSDAAKRQNIDKSPSLNPNMTEQLEVGQELGHLREELRKEIALATQKVGNDLRDEIAMVSKKIGEICVSHGSVVNSLQFHSDYLETLNTKISKIDLGAHLQDERMDKMEHGLRDQRNKLLGVNREVQDYGREIKARNIVINGLSEKKR